MSPPGIKFMRTPAIRSLFMSSTDLYLKGLPLYSPADDDTPSIWISSFTSLSTPSTVADPRSAEALTILEGRDHTGRYPSFFSRPSYGFPNNQCRVRWPKRSTCPIRLVGKSSFRPACRYASGVSLIIGACKTLSMIELGFATPTQGSSYNCFTKFSTSFRRALKQRPISPCMSCSYSSGLFMAGLNGDPLGASRAASRPFCVKP